MEKIKTLHKNSFWAGLLALGVFTLIYHWYFNRFSPITEGWFHTYAAAMQQGKVPYKDFYMFIPPLYLYIYLGIISLFGGAFVVFRIYGIFERLGLNALVYTMLAKHFKPSTALFAVIVGFCLYANHNVDTIYSYYQTSLLPAIIAVYLLSKFDSDSTENKQFLFVLGAGTFAAISFLIKQTTGFFIIIAALSYLFLVLLRKNPKKIFLAFAAVLLPVILLFAAQMLFMAHIGALQPFIDQVFTKGVASKGSMSSMLFNFRYGFLSALNNILLIIFSSIWAAIVYYKDKPYPKTFSPLAILGLIGAGGVAFIIAAVVLYYNITTAKLFFIHCTFCFVVLCGAYYTYKAFTRKLTSKEGFFLLLSGASFAIMYSHSLSCLMDELCAFLGPAFFIAVILDTPTWHNKLKNIFVVSLLSAFALAMLINRYSIPYDWWGDMQGNVFAARYKVEGVAAFKGLRMSKESADRYTEIAALVRQNITTPQDKIYINQNITGLYYALGAQPFTFAYTDYFDVCNDDYAKRNAQDVLTQKPKVIIYMDFPEYAWQLHESLFRGGKHSGQREIPQAIRALLPQYQLVKKYTENKSFLDNNSLYVLVRK